MSHFRFLVPFSIVALATVVGCGAADDATGKSAVRIDGNHKLVLPDPNNPNGSPNTQPPGTANDPPQPPPDDQGEGQGDPPANDPPKGHTNDPSPDGGAPDPNDPGFVPPR